MTIGIGLHQIGATVEIVGFLDTPHAAKNVASNGVNIAGFMEAPRENDVLQRRTRHGAHVPHQCCIRQAIGTDLSAFLNALENQAQLRLQLQRRDCVAPPRE